MEESSGRTAGPAKALGVAFVIGAILMAGVASGIWADWPVNVDSHDLTGVNTALGAWLSIYLVMAVIVVADAGRLTRQRNLEALQDSANTVKLFAVPFFILNFLALTELVIVAGLNDDDHLGLNGLLAAMLFVVLTYLVMLPTSAYGVGCLLLLRRSDSVGRIFFGLNLVLQFLFVVDVISTIIVVEVARDRLGHGRKPRKLQQHLLAGILIPASAVATVWLVFAAAFYLFDRHWSFLWDGMHQLTFSSTLAFVLLVLVPVVPLITLRAAVRLFLGNDLDALKREARTVKLVMIPLFVQNFLLGAFTVLVVAFFPAILTKGMLLTSTPVVIVLGAIAAAGFVPVLFGTWLMMLPTSIYSIACLALLTRLRVVTPRFCAVHTILQLVFVTDIISTLVIANRARQVGMLEGHQGGTLAGQMGAGVNVGVPAQE